MSTIIPKRHCDYRDCKEYRDKYHPNPDVKFFSFPSDHPRKKKWLELSQTKSEHPKYICSRHFEDKYISHSQRRVHLVTSAVPTEYKLTVSNDNTMMDDNNDDISEIENNDEVLEIDSDFETQSNSHEISSENSKLIWNSIVSTPLTKRKLEISRLKLNNSNDYKKVKLVKINPSNAKILNKSMDFKNDEREIKFNIKQNQINESLTVQKLTLENDKNMHTVLFGGVEYIQMPKSQYIKEKMEMLTVIENYRYILKDFKDKLENVELS